MDKKHGNHRGTMASKGITVIIRKIVTRVDSRKVEGMLKIVVFTSLSSSYIIEEYAP